MLYYFELQRRFRGQPLGDGAKSTPFNYIPHAGRFEINLVGDTKAVGVSKPKPRPAVDGAYTGTFNFTCEQDTITEDYRGPCWVDGVPYTVGSAYGGYALCVLLDKLPPQIINNRHHQLLKRAEYWFRKSRTTSKSARKQAVAKGQKALQQSKALESSHA